ncbi:MAG: DNA repair protein RecN [Porticoccaceae bacterium]|nr:DNA repair protein RecN [Porticoccaceae bacterium]
MLLSITINNYTLVDSLDIEFSSGTTAITGETGAGKSLILDALSMALGDRADSSTIRQGKERAQITASFDVSAISAARQWLEAQDYADDNECILRRTYNTEGRSRGYINGQPCTMQQLQQLGDLLVDLHSQHEHQSLLRRSTHRKLLDEFAASSELAGQVEQCFQDWHLASKKLHDLAERSEELTARSELLQFQVEELREFNLQPHYLQQLEQEQQNLANAEQIIQDSQQLLAISDQGETFNLRDGFHQSLSILSQLKHKPKALEEAEQLLQSGLIQVDEAVRCIEQHIDGFEADPQRLQQIEDELGLIFQLARKHRVDSPQLEEKLNELDTDLKQLTAGDQNLEALQQQVDEFAANYKKAAAKLSLIRQQGAAMMSEQINQQLQQLSMEGAELLVKLTPLEENNFKSYGLEDIELVISTNPGQAHKPLAKVASGGELSRVSLAIQVVAAANSSIPTVVFDEVDVGIGGSTADIVGQLLKQLGDRGQVISVTHQPQVAAHAHQHYVVSKMTDNSRAESSIVHLDQAQRIEELARMLGGAKVTQQTLSHASELLDLANI